MLCEPNGRVGLSISLFAVVIETSHMKAEKNEAMDWKEFGRIDWCLYCRSTPERCVPEESRLVSQ